jgi:predicted ester cyclase
VTVDQNLAVIRDYHERVWVHDDLSALDEYWDPAAAVEVTGFDDGTIEAIREDVLRYRGAFTDVRTSILDLLGQDDQVVLHWETTGRHVGPYGSVAATGRDITMTGVDIFRLAGGRIVACRSLWDGLSVYAQMGVLDYPE